MTASLLPISGGVASSLFAFRDYICLCTQPTNEETRSEARDVVNKRTVWRGETVCVCVYAIRRVVYMLLVLRVRIGTPLLCIVYLRGFVFLNVRVEREAFFSLVLCRFLCPPLVHLSVAGF